MRRFFILVSVFLKSCAFSQDSDIDQEMVQELENTAEETDDGLGDSQVNDFVYFNKHPVNLNTADEEDLKSLNVLNDLQIARFLLYRRLLGPLIHLYELQAVPSWDIRTIRRLLPLVIVRPQTGETLKQAFVNGEQNILIRFGKGIEPSTGLVENKYLGSSTRLMVKYRYRYKGQLSWGLTGEKDAGEPFLRSAQKAGFDFYGAHLFLRKAGIFDCLALGDFTANIGQGLIHWQSLAYKKSAAVINIKRQSPVLKPYASTGEFNFLRGIGLTTSRNNASLTVFFSSRKLSANLEEHSPDGQVSISSFVTSGNHRTVAEMENRKAAAQFSAGSIMRFAFTGWQVSLNSICHHYAYPLLKQQEPYNLYALKGKTFINNSIDYSFTRGNLHYFAEWATDRHLNLAVIQGLMMAVDRHVDAALLFRHIGSRYQSVSGNAFTENSLPTNETGFYSALTVRPTRSITIDCYFDLFKFPIVKYRVNAGSSGSEYLFTITFKPNKQLAFYSRFRSSAKAMNDAGSLEAIDPVVFTQTKHFRNHMSLQLNRTVTLQNRFELSSFAKEGTSKQQGVMLYTDLSYKPEFSRWSARARFQHFDIDSYEARIYAYEAKMLFMSSIPAFHGQGMKYLFNFNYRLKIAEKQRCNLQTSVSWTQTIYKGIESIGAGLETIQGRRRSDISLQAILVKG